MTIRAEGPADVPSIAAVVAAAFGSQAEAHLVARIRASPQFVPEWSLVADVEGEIAGHVMISYATIVDGRGERRVAMLSPLAVAPARQRQGIGSALVRSVTALAAAAGEPLVILQGDPAFYGRLGFEPAADYGIAMPLPSWAPPEAAQVMRLPLYDDAVRGRVAHPPAFDEVADR
ncbi:MAG: N-acetyltransferase [Actinobacteria bacterium]|nr:MAG: N-acetyltransferase [Actinomycetota bacterium]